MSGVDLLALAAQCEQAIAEPGTPEEWEARFMLDAAIHRACADYDCGDDELPAYTGSIDAAATLVPEGWSVGIGHLPGADWIIRAHLRDHRPESLSEGGHSQFWREGHSKTFALALTAACLRARHQSAAGEEGQ